MPEWPNRVTELLARPRHMGVLTEADCDPATEYLLTGEGRDVRRANGVRLMLRLRRADNCILDARFQNFGNALSVAGASCFCGLALGKTLDEALRIGALDLDRELGGSPELKLRLPALVLLALDTAVLKLRGLPPRESGLPGEETLCKCFQVHESTIERAIRLRGLKTLAEVSAATRACTGCGTCCPEVEPILQRCLRGEFKLRLTPEDYEAAQRIYGVRPGA